jgi:hypothetical protein
VVNWGVDSAASVFYFAMFATVDGLCVLAVWIVCWEGGSKAHKLCFWQLSLCSELLMYGPFPNG